MSCQRSPTPQALVDTADVYGHCLGASDVYVLDTAKAVPPAGGSKTIMGIRRPGATAEEMRRRVST